MISKRSEPYLSTYLHRQGARLGLPIAGNFELTARCNFNCPMCYVHQNEEQISCSGKKELTAAQWLSLAKEARDMGMIFVLLTGGEPLVRKDFFEIYDGMKKMGLLISINTNGSLLQGEIFERFLKDPPYRFNISLYGGSDETYQNMCGLPMYERVKGNIKALREAGVQVSINLSVTPFNCLDIEQIYADATELDVNVKASFYMYPAIRLHTENSAADVRLTETESAEYSYKWDSLRFTEEEFRQRAENMLNLVGDESEGCPTEEGEGVRCRAGSTSFWMTWDGRMLPCGMLTTPEAYPLKVGFAAAWEKIRGETAKIRLPSKCVNCGYKDICGVCAAVCFAETGRFDGVPEYMCKRTQETLRLMKAGCADAERKENEN